MIVLIIGTPNSGKSELAERITCELAGGGSKIYLATMIAYDEEGEKRIEKHRLAREGKGFCTFEKPYQVAQFPKDDCKAEKFHENEPDGKPTILLECISNLVGNEMYENVSRREMEPEELTDAILSDIQELSEKALHLVIVTNQFPLLQEGYDEDTVRYVQTIDLMNQKLRLIADRLEDMT